MKKTTTTTARATSARVDRFRAAREAHADALDRLTTARRVNTAAEGRAVDAVRARRAAELDRLAEALEAARDELAEAREAEDRARVVALLTRAALTADDLPAYIAADVDGRDLLALCAASAVNALKRRAAETGADVVALRLRFARLADGTAGETQDAEAVTETAARLLALAASDWADGVRVDDEGNETRRGALPLAYAAAVAAGQAVDVLLWTYGGHVVQMTAAEAREAYGNAPELAPLCEALETARAAREAARREAARLEQVAARVRLAAATYAVAMTTADAETAAELAPAFRALCAASLEADAAAAEAAEDLETAREDAADALAAANRAARHFASEHRVTDVRPLCDPVAPSPEAALLEAEQVAEVFAALRADARAADVAARALALAVEFYRGADSLREAAREAGLPWGRGVINTWAAVQAAAAEVAEGNADAARAAAEHVRQQARDRAQALYREGVETAREAARLEAMTVEVDPALESVTMWREVDERTREPAPVHRLAPLATWTPEALRNMQAFASAMYRNAATR
jgi:hypothetical protein